MILSFLCRINSDMTSLSERDPFTFLIQSIFLVFAAFLSLCSSSHFYLSTVTYPKSAHVKGNFSPGFELCQAQMF